MKLRRLLLLALLLAATALAARPQVCAADAPLRRTLPVNVLDAEGNLVRGLTAADFRGEFRSQPVKILSVTPDTSPRRIVILLDISGSMEAPPNRMSLALTAVEDIAVYASPQTRVALLVFADRIVDKSHFRDGRVSLAAKLAAMKAGTQPPYEAKGRTALADAMHEAVQLLAPPGLGDAVYVVSDGGDNRSQSRYGDVQRELLAAGIRVFGFIPSAPVASRAQPELVWGPARLTDAARDTGGGWIQVEVFPRVQQDLPALAAETRPLYEQMAEFYRLEVELPVGVSEPRGWKLEVVDAGGKRRKGVQVVYPRKLAPCTPPPTP